ncbi:MAG TPA: class I SAM-dependent methyltransferase [Polyangiaceae bacterium]|nr:class I SAM-dependent methyltransferase [Polyangiaceae bacterium]
MRHFDDLSSADAAILETFVVPRYLSLYANLLLEMLLTGDAARVAHLGCRTGYPDLELFERIPNMRLVGVDSSSPALELARNKAHAKGEVGIDYVIAEGYPTGLEAEQYSHALSLHPILDQPARTLLLQELARLLYSGGQALIAMPMRGSFQEITDIFKEYALKEDAGEFSKALESALPNRPTLESLSEELEAAGLSDIDVKLQHRELEFESGRGLVEDPAMRLLILPEIRSWMHVDDLDGALDYLARAIDKYWSEDKLLLSVNVGCASARKP